ncbi:uncharacterized protein DFL_008992 [Arthrobotrys flagrans]|uniref:Uncharacterized protein n=1 Tax=Arthrobotrys flagrans TaxID=97331 RepID=A0A436ZQD9_ARTFL|nr:hypothetical protein DFL_008992 [Arthrobotrys flagrans]
MTKASRATSSPPTLSLSSPRLLVFNRTPPPPLYYRALPYDHPLSFFECAISRRGRGDRKPNPVGPMDGKGNLRRRKDQAGYKVPTNGTLKSRCAV